MNRLSLASVAVAAAFASLTVTGAAAKVIQIEIEKLVFTPKSVTAEVGDTIEWTNKDVFAHTATEDDKSWEVVLPPRATGSYVVENAGIIGYFCRFHPNMRGMIEAPEP